jgi:hypothetical protein
VISKSLLGQKQNQAFSSLLYRRRLATSKKPQRNHAPTTISPRFSCSKEQRHGSE